MKIKSIRNTKIRTKLIILGAVSTLGLFIIGSESVSTAWQINQVGDEISQVWMTAVVTAEELNTATSDYRIQESRHAIATDKGMMEEIEANLRVMEQDISDKFRLYQSLPTMERDQELIRRAESVWQEYLKASQEVLKTSQTNSRQRVLDLMMGESQTLFDEVSGLFLESVEATKEETSQARTEADALYKRMSHMKLLVITLDVVIVLILILYLIRSIEKPAEALAEAARRATNGNLDVCLDYDSEDEIGILTEAMNTLIRRLRSIIDDEKQMFRALGEENFHIHSECEQSYRGDFATLLYSFTSLQSRLKANRQKQEDEIHQLETRIAELENQLKERNDA